MSEQPEKKSMSISFDKFKVTIDWKTATVIAGLLVWGVTLYVQNKGLNNSIQALSKANEAQAATIGRMAIDMKGLQGNVDNMNGILQIMVSNPNNVLVMKIGDLRRALLRISNNDAIIREILDWEEQQQGNQSHNTPPPTFTTSTITSNPTDTLNTINN